MRRFDYDMITIGAGSGGIAASRRAAAHGAKVALSELGRVGGTCVLRGCVPKKLLWYGTSIREHISHAPAYGWSFADASLDWGKLVAAKRQELDRLEGIYRRLLDDAGVELLAGRGVLVDPHTIEIDGRAFTARYLLVATGSWPSRPDVRGADLAISSNEALELDRLPRTMIIIGGGYVGCELASIFCAAGVVITQIVRTHAVLRDFDEDVRSCLGEGMRARGIRIETEAELRSIASVEDGLLSVRLQRERTIEAELVLLATGRTPNTSALGLENLGVALGPRGEIRVDRWSRSNVASVFAVGDVTDRVNLTPIAIAEGRALADTLFGNTPIAVDHANVPSAVFSLPPVAAVGLTETRARALGHPIDVYRSKFRPLRHGVTGRQETTLIKLIVARESDRVLGCHMVGEDAPEVIQGLAIALQCGATKRQFDATIGIHPTAAEEFVTLRTPVRDDGDA